MRSYLCFFFCILIGSSFAGEPLPSLTILLPQNRTAFQTNEWIDVSVLCASNGKSVTLTLTDGNGGKMSATFAARKSGATTTEHFHVNAALLRPDKYTLEASEGEASAKTEIEVFSHIRKSEFKLINWGRADKPAEQRIQGEDSLGFNLFYGAYGLDTNADFIRAGCDYMRCCAQGGAHQMDIRLECDWSDPYVIRGGTQRAAREAFMDRTRPNVWGVHFYDEPGLTWGKDATNNDLFTPHAVAAQRRSFESAFGFAPPDYKTLDPKNEEKVAAWNHWARWKLSLMDAYEKETAFGVSMVRPDYVSITQSQYAGTAFTDGYYFNVVRSMPIVSGHGGYDDYGPGIFNPVYTLELARARNWDKPNWYLPTWYGNMPSDRFRLEQNLCFMTNLQGMIVPPDLEPARNASARQGIVETNHLYQQLGPIFNHMPVTKPPVAILYSLSNAIHHQIENTSKNYLHEMPHGRALPIAYMAGKVTQYQFCFVLDEDVLDGTLANDHKAVILTGLDYIDPKVIAALEDFAAKGGVIIETAESSVQVKGAIKIALPAYMLDEAIINKLYGEKNYKEAEQYTTTRKWMESALPLGQAIKAELLKRGIPPIFECDQPGIIATRQVSGDVEYIFAVNASYDETSTEKHAIKAVEAKITLKRLYKELGRGVAQLEQPIRFGPGEMRVFFGTRQSIRTILSRPEVRSTLTGETPAISLNFDASSWQGITDPPVPASFHSQVSPSRLSGSVPLIIEIFDASKNERFSLYRATDGSNAKISVPLALNDVSGAWSVHVMDLMNHSVGRINFDYTPPRSFPALFGANPRAVSADRDRENLFRFARTHHAVSIVKGKSAFNDAAAERLIKILKPWGVECKVVELADASKPRELTEEEALAWCGLEPGKAKAGGGNDPKVVGFAVQGPVILLGNPEDNPMIKFLLDTRFLPYKPQPGIFPGNNRGMFAWQRDAIGRGQESVTLIAYDEAGMSEAVGSAYEAIAGIEPLMKYVLPESHSINPKAPGLDVMNYHAVQLATLTDRVDAFRVDDGKLVALVHDNTECAFQNDGLSQFNAKVLSRADYEAAVKAATPAPIAELQAAMKRHTRPDRLVKSAIQGGNWIVVTYWGGTVRIVGKEQQDIQLPQDVTALGYFNDKFVLGLADGRVFTLK